MRRWIRERAGIGALLLLLGAGNAVGAVAGAESALAEGGAVGSMSGLNSMSSVSMANAAGPALRLSGLLHAGMIDYGRSTYKERGYAGGLYLALGWGRGHDLELDGGWTRIEYRDFPNLDQEDWSVAYTHTRGRSYGRAGLHYIVSDDPLTDAGRVFFGGLAHWGRQDWSGGVDGALSLYGSGGEASAVWQVAPWWSWWMQSLSGRRSLRTTATLFWIHLDKESFLVPPGMDSDYFSAAVNLAYRNGRLGLNAQAWGGEQSYAVRRRGLVVYNLAELRTGGFGGSASWRVGSRVALKVGVHREYLREFGALDPLALTAYNLGLGVSR